MEVSQKNRWTRSHLLEWVVLGKKSYVQYIVGNEYNVIHVETFTPGFQFGTPGACHSGNVMSYRNWDGLGRLSRCIYTAGIASAFDTNLKRVRFSASVMFSLSIGVEPLTPVFPRYFLLLASIANIAKQISLASYLATNTAIRRSFAIADNLGEVSAKAQIQTVCFDNLGLLLAAVLNILPKNNQSLQAGLPFVIFPIFSAVDLFGIYQGLKHVHLQTLTKDRLEIILNIWIESGYVPSPAEMSKEEGIDFLCSKDKTIWPIRIGCLNPKDQIPMLSMMAMQYSRGEDYYFICMEIFCKGAKRTKQHGILLCLREGAGTEDIIMGLLQHATSVRPSFSKQNLERTKELAKDKGIGDGGEVEIGARDGEAMKISVRAVSGEAMKIGVRAVSEVRGGEVCRRSVHQAGVFVRARSAPGGSDVGLI
nr:protein root uvb sensitive 4 [Quercus suber]